MTSAGDAPGLIGMIADLSWSDLGAVIGGLTGPIGAAGTAWGIYERWRARRDDAIRRGPSLKATVWPAEAHGWMRITLVIERGEVKPFDVMSIEAAKEDALFTRSIPRSHRLRSADEPDEDAATVGMSWSAAGMLTVRRSEMSISRWIKSSTLSANSSTELEIRARCRFISGNRDSFRLETKTRNVIDQY